MTSHSKLGRQIALCALASLAACRFRFKEAADASPEVPPDSGDALADAPLADGELSPDSPTGCQLGPWTEPVGGQPFALVNTPDIQWSAALSSDGLLLLFFSDPSIFVAQRDSPTEPFRAATRLTISNNAKDREPTLNDRELYFLSGQQDYDCIYVASRMPAPQLWGPPRRLDSLCANVHFTGGMYISRDGKHLYYEAAAGATSQLLMASRTDVSQDFASPGVPVLLPVGMKYCSLTGDELTIYCETEVSGAPDLQLWQATRKDLGSQFGEAQKVPDLDTTGFDVSDPSISADGRQLLYGVSVGGANADLRLVERRCQ